MKEVKLLELSGAALIVPGDTGVYFTNQVDGGACRHPVCEGILIPINNDMPADHQEHLERMLCLLFDGGWGTITKQKADQIDAVLQSYPETKGISVDRDLLHRSVEAWTYVIGKETEYSCYSGFGEIRGILTWRNSD